MKLRSIFIAGLIAFLAVSEVSAVVISEFMAVNESTLRDEDGDFSDFAEFYNDEASPVDMGGYFVTDDPAELTKWRFPSVTIPAGGFLIAFASDKDRVDPDSELHFNFKLTSVGEYFALVAPDGVTILSEFDPFPPQVADFSYGLEQNATLVELVEAGDSARAFVPSNGNLGLSWTEAGFSDGGWRSGRTGVGYDENTTYDPLILLDVEGDMNNENTSCYIRVPFSVPDPSGIGSFVLRMNYDDGFIAYLNGDRVASANAPAGADWDSTATNLHDDGLAVEYEEFAFAGSLRAGTNVLAIHGLNDNIGSSDFVIRPELDGSSAGELNPDITQYFHQPTPGGANLPGFPGISETPAFDTLSTVFTGSLSVRLSVTAGDAVVHYTTDGSEPDEDSPVAAGPISVTTSTLIRARSIQPGLSPSPIVSEGFAELSSTVANFTSDIPVFLVENFASGSVPANSHQEAFMFLFEPDETGRTRFSNPPTVTTRIGIKIRGSSTQNRPKKAYGVEIWDEKNEDRDISLLGLPEESDWILYGAYNFDHALMRNAFIYELSNQVGVYASRTKFCEMYINTGGGSMASSDYVGVYSLIEKIKRGPDRVDVERLTASMVSPPLVTGGYMTKIDRLDPGDSGVSAGGQRMGWVYPKEELVTSEQSQYYAGYINTFISALNGQNFRDPNVGYARYIDTQLWVDHHVINVLAFNVDALRLSTYMYKPRSGPLIMGPIWDFDRAMGSTDGRDSNPLVWTSGGGTDFFNYPWWERLFDDPDFWQLWIDRYQTLREAQFRTSHMHGIINEMAGEIAEAAPRNHTRWGFSNWPGAVTHLRSWLQRRASWMDSQFVRIPELSSGSREIDPGFELEIDGNGTIYYKTDGTDPRGDNGVRDGDAIRYTGPITLTENSKVIARAFTANNYSNWSGPATASFWTEIPRLVVTEIMYHPPTPLGDSPYSDDDFEFVEFMNTTDEPLDLEGFVVSGAVDFTFGSGPDLAPGAYVVVVENLDAFESRYDTTGIRIAGEYVGNVDNSGEQIIVTGPLGEPVQDFRFEDEWYPVTDGVGFSLVILDPFDGLERWSSEDAWVESSVVLGTPGEDDPGLGNLGGRQQPGDSNQDGILDVSDPLSYLIRLFGGGGQPMPCDGGMEEGGNLALFDANGDSGVDITDAVYMLDYLFRGGPAHTLGTHCVRLEGCPNVCGF